MAFLDLKGSCLGSCLGEFCFLNQNILSEIKPFVITSLVQKCLHVCVDVKRLSNTGNQIKPS